MAAFQKWWTALRAPSDNRAHAEARELSDEMRELASQRAASKGALGDRASAKRDEIALVVLPALVVRLPVEVRLSPYQVATIAYEIADAMLEVRKQ